MDASSTYVSVENTRSGGGARTRTWRGGFGDRSFSQLTDTPADRLVVGLLHFLVADLFAARAAELLHLQLELLLLAALEVIILVLADGAAQNDDVSITHMPFPLRDDIGDDAGADRVAAFANGEAQALLHRDRRDQL